MKNLVPYKEDCFEIHKTAVNNKQNGELKERLLVLNPAIREEYDKFIQKFNAHQLNTLIPNSGIALSKDDLLSLYRYQSKTITLVRESIRKLQIKTIISTCQNCTLDSANTLDHLLPKSNFPEFIVNPKNLFPCCSTCNSYKLDAIANAGPQKFLNLYLDELPHEQYLFVDVFMDPYNEIDFHFFLNNIDSRIDPELYSVIENHFAKLHLFERMRLKCIEYISELETKILVFKPRLSIDEIISDLIVAANKDKEAYGFNHWKCILEITLLESPIFIDRYR